MSDRNEFLAYIGIAAVEGGITYWADIRNYRVTYSSAGTIAGPVTDVSVEVRDREGYGAKWLAVDLATIRKGLDAIRKSDFRMARSLVATVLAADRDNDAGDIDAELADCIVQAGLFGKLVYG